MVSDRLRLDDPIHQLIHDDPMDFFAFGGVRTHESEPVSCEFFGVDITLDKRARSDETETPEPALGRPRRHDLSDVHPG